MLACRNQGLCGAGGLTEVDDVTLECVGKAAAHRRSLVLHRRSVAWQAVNELACGVAGRASKRVARGRNGSIVGKSHMAHLFRVALLLNKRQVEEFFKFVSQHT